MLGADPNGYNFEEKLAIIQAYKKGGGVEGLKDIVDNEDGDGEGQQFGSQQEGDDDGENEIDIDLNNPEDVKIIDEEFQKIYNTDDQFRTNFGEQALMLTAMQKYQIIEAYNQNGMEAVMALLANSADQSGIM